MTDSTPEAVSPAAQSASSPLILSPLARAAWMAFFLSPGLLAAGGALWKSLRNAEMSRAEMIALKFCLFLLVINAGALAWKPLREGLLRRRLELLLMAGALAVSLAAAEGFLQWLLVKPAERGQGTIFRADPELGFDHIPNAECLQTLEGVYEVAYHINNRGTRGAPWSDPRPGKPLILALGCSQTFGHGLEDAETWPARLEARLDGSRVINGAVAAYGPQQFYLRGKRLIAEAQPQVILIGLGSFHLVRLGVDDAWNANIGNYGLRLPVLGADAEDRLVVEKLVPEQVPPRDEVTLFHRDAGPRRFESQLYLFAKKQLLGFAEWLQSAPPSPEAIAQEKAHLAEQLSRLDVAIRGCGELQRETGARVALILLPEPDAPNREAFREAVRKSAAREGLEVWDIDADVEKIAGRNLMLSRFHEPHFNPRAADAIAEVLAERLREKKN
jgi:hypothetical protein